MTKATKAQIRDVIRFFETHHKAKGMLKIGHPRCPEACCLLGAIALVMDNDASLGYNPKYAKAFGFRNEIEAWRFSDNHTKEELIAYLQGLQDPAE